MNYERLVNFDVDSGGLFDAICTLQDKKPSLLTTEKKAVMLEGYAESGVICCHLKVHNPTKDTVTFIVSKPPIWAISISPKVGVVKANGDCWIYIKFSGRFGRVPDDGILIMSIYQAKLEFIDGGKLDSIKTASRVGRRYWSLPENHGKEAEFVLHLPLTWKSKKDNPLHEEHIDVFKKETEGGGGGCLDATAAGGKP